MASAAAAGAVSGSATTGSVSVIGPAAASWASATTTSFTAQSLSASAASVTAASGQAVGTGSVALASAAGVAVSVSGSVNYSVSGQANLSFYPPATGNLGGSADWSSFNATLSGTDTIELTTNALTLNGTLLPAGTYILSTPSATIGGSGLGPAANSGGAVSMKVTGGTVYLGSGTGSLSVGGTGVEAGNGISFTGFNGTATVATGATADSVTLSGTTTQVLSVAGNPATLTTNQNTPVTLDSVLRTSLAGTYAVVANAPSGWSVTIDNSGQLTITPAPGVQAGTFPIQLIVQSASDLALVAQSEVMVTVKPTAPAISLAVNPDPEILLPFDGAQLPFSFQAVIHNSGPAADTYNLSFSNVPSGFTVASSNTSVTVPAGQTGIVGVYLIPNAGQPLPAPGTVLSFSVTATSTTTSTITKTQTVTLTVPAIDALSITGSSTSVNTTPGVAATDTLTITNVGNVPENNVTLAASNSSGLTLSGLAPLSLAVGQSNNETITLTPAATTPLNSQLQSTVTATYGPSASPQTQSLDFVLDVVVPGAAAIANAAVAAQALNNSGLAGRLQDLSTALTNLVQNPTSAVYKAQAQANLASLISQITNDPFLSGFTSGLTAASTALSAAATAAQIQTAITNLGNSLNSFAQVISDDAAHNFTLSLSPSINIVEPAAPEVYDIVMTNNGTAATTYDLSVSGLPAGVTSAFSQPSVTLQPGQSLTTGNNAVTLTLTESGDTLVAANFNVTAKAEGATEITQNTPGMLTLRTTSIVATGILTNPSYTNPGGKVDVSAQILGTVNQSTQISAYYTVTDSTGKVLYTSTPAPVAVTANSGLITLDLGNLDTTGFAKGIDTITVTLLDATNKPIPGGSTSTTYLIGQPVTATLSTTPTSVPTGSDTVTTTLSVTTQSTYPSPLTLQGAVATPAPGTSVALYTSGSSTYAYESGTGGIDVINVTDPSNPQLVETFGQGDIVNGQFGFNVARVVGNELLVGTSNGNNGSVFNLLVYSLTNPDQPRSSSATPRSTTASSTTCWSTAPARPSSFQPAASSTSGSFIYQDFGDFVSIDLSNPTQPALAGSLFNNEGQPDGGDMSQFGGVLVNDQIAYSAGLDPGRRHDHHEHRQSPGREYRRSQEHVAGHAAPDPRNDQHPRRRNLR